MYTPFVSTWYCSRWALMCRYASSWTIWRVAMFCLLYRVEAPPFTQAHGSRARVRAPHHVEADGHQARVHDHVAQPGSEERFPVLIEPGPVGSSRRDPRRENGDQDPGAVKVDAEEDHVMRHEGETGQREREEA